MNCTSLFCVNFKGYKQQEDIWSGHCRTHRQEGNCNFNWTAGQVVVSRLNSVHGVASLDLSVQTSVQSLTLNSTLCH